jgi:hypothetical protein
MPRWRQAQQARLRAVLQAKDYRVQAGKALPEEKDGVKTTFSQTTSGPVLSNPSVTCSLIPAPPLPSAPADQWFAMTVTLKVHDSLGNVSAVATNKVVRLFPQGSCGF